MLLTLATIAVGAYATARLIRLSPSAAGATAPSTDGPGRPFEPSVAPDSDPLGGMLDETYARMVDAVERVRPADDTRRSRIRSLVGADPATPTTAREQDANRGVVIATGTFACATLGRLALPPVLWLAAPGLIHRWMGIGRQAAADWREERAIKDAAAILILHSAMLATGHIWTAAMIQLVYSLVDKMLAAAYDDSKGALAEVFGDLPATALVERDGRAFEIDLGELRKGDVVIIQAGAVVPVDGEVLRGVATIDQHMLTGESEPVLRQEGEAVLAGTLVMTGRAWIVVEHAGLDTVIARIGAILEQTTDFRTRGELRCEEVVDRSVLPTLGAGAITWAVLGPTAGIAAITCGIGYHMRFTGPLCIQNYLRWSAERGILVKDGRALENAPEVDTVVFDKTGTLTEARPTVVAVHTLGDYSADDLLRWAASAEHRQAHPIAEAIVHATTAAGQELVEARDVECIVGHGIRAIVGDAAITVGSARFLVDQGLGDMDAARRCLPSIGADSGLVFVAVNGRAAGAIELAARLRPEAAAVVDALQSRGLAVWMLSGDHEVVTRAVAERLGVDGHIAEVLPQQKADVIRGMQEEGRRVCFVGDGINDAIALKVAHTSISLNGATTAALDNAQVILATADLALIPDFLEIASAFDGAMQRNFVGSFLPAAVNLTGIYALGTGIITGAACSWAGLAAGAVNSSIRPRINPTRAGATSAQAKRTEEQSTPPRPHRGEPALAL